MNDNTDLASLRDAAEAVQEAVSGLVERLDTLLLAVPENKRGTIAKYLKQELVYVANHLDNTFGLAFSIVGIDYEQPGAA